METSTFTKNALVLLVVLLAVGVSRAEEYVADAATVGLWHLNESSGTNAPDSSATGNHGTLVGTTLPTWTTGVYGNGLHFTRDADDGLDLGAAITNRTTFTLEFDFKWDYIYHSEPGYLYDNGGTTFARTNLIERGASPALARITFGVRLDNSAWMEINTGEQGLDATKFIHVSLMRIWDGSSTTARIYLDYELVAEQSDPHGFWNANSDLIIGAGGTGGIGGTFDEIRLSSVAREYCGDWGYLKGDVNSDCYVKMDDMEILATRWLSTGEGYEDTTATTALYHLDEESGTVASDDNSSGRAAHDGTLTGTTLPTWTTGLFGNGLHFNRDVKSVDDDGEALQMGDVVHTSASFTLEFNFKWDYAYQSEPGYLFSAGGTAWARTSLIERDPMPALARISFGVRKDDGFWLETNTGDVGLDAEKFMHLAFVREWDGTNTRARIYLEGELVADANTPKGFWDDGSDLMIGNGGNVDIGGTFDEIRFTKAELTEFGTPDCETKGYDEADTNKDCRIDVQDFSDVSHTWMQCTDPEDADCINCYGHSFAEFAVDSGTMALWHMNEGTGSAINDATGSYDLTISGPYIWSAGKFDDGLTSPAFPEGEYCITDTPLPFTDADPDVYQMSMSAWVKLGGTSPQGSYALSLDTTAFVRVDSGGSSVAVGFYGWDNLGTWHQASYEPMGAGQPVNADGLWHHVAGVYDGMPDGMGNGNVSMFWDGELVDTTTFAVPTEGIALVDIGSGDLYIGTSSGDPGDPNNRFVGSIDEVRISNTARTDFFPGACE